MCNQNGKEHRKERERTGISSPWNGPMEGVPREPFKDFVPTMQDITRAQLQIWWEHKDDWMNWPPPKYYPSPDRDEKDDVIF